MATVWCFPNRENVRPFWPDILAVDDEPDARELIRHVLGRNRAKVVVVGSVREAIEAFEKLNPDILVSDIGMPDEDATASSARSGSDRPTVAEKFLPSRLPHTFAKTIAPACSRRASPRTFLSPSNRPSSSA